MELRELIWKLSAAGAGKFSDDIKKADGQVDDLKNSMEKTDKATKSTFKGMQESLKSTGSKLKSIGGGMAKTGAVMTAATLPLAIKLKQGISDARDLDTAIRQVTTLSDENILPTAELKKVTKRISNESGIMQTEVANAMYEALSSGINTEDVVGFTEQGLKLAKAGFTDLPTVIDATTTALNAYGDEAMDVKKIQDIMVKTQDLGKITVDELAKSMGRVIPTAAASGVGLDQLGAGYSLLTARGMDASLATTTMNSMLAELSATGTKSDKALRQMTGKSFKELTAEGKNIGEVLDIINNSAKSAGLGLSDMFGNLNAGKAAESIMKVGVDVYTGTLQQMRESDGAVEANFKKMMGDELDKAKAVEQIRNAFIDMGTQVLPIIANITKKIGDLAQKFQELSPKQQKILGAIALGVVAIGPVLTMLGGLALAIGTISTGLGGILLPVLGVTAGLAALVAGGVLLISNWDLIKEKARAFSESIKSKLGGACDYVKSGFESLKGSVNNALESIKSKWESVREFFSNPIKGVVTVANNIKDRVMKKIPSHATGLDSVPYDNYTANLHKGEMVLTSGASNKFRNLGGTKDKLPNLVESKTIDNTKNTTNTSNKSFSIPSINIYISDDGTRRPKDIGAEVRSELAKFFDQLQLQWG